MLRPVDGRTWHVGPETREVIRFDEEMSEAEVDSELPGGFGGPEGPGTDGTSMAPEEFLKSLHEMISVEVRRRPFLWIFH